MFDHALTDHADEQRLQRLTLAAAIALTGSAAGLATVATLERFGIDRVHAPKQQLEVVSFSALAAPELIDPPPPPPPSDGGAAPTSDPGPRTPRPATVVYSGVAESGDPRDDPSTASDASASASEGRPSPLGALGCPPGVRCDGGPTGPGGPGPIGIGTSNGASLRPPSPDPAPTEVDFKALRCLACADPDQASLRKLAATVHQRRGQVSVRFCVDVHGRVEPASIEVSSSYGVAAVDRVTTTAVARWRFSPLKVAGTARRACSSAKFHIRFDGPA